MKIVLMSTGVIAIVALLIPFTRHDSGELEQVSDFKWQNRLIIVFADGSEQYPIKKQLEVENYEIEDRDILWFVVSRNSVATNYTRRLSRMLANNLWQAYVTDASAEVEVILVGKDGGVKYRADALNTFEIYQRIDQMPMRRAEMREKENGE